MDEAVISPLICNGGVTGCKDQPAVSLGDNCFAHSSDEVLNKLARRGIFIITSPPHVAHSSSL
jgi:hypothetical protein